MRALRTILLLLGFALSPAMGADVRMFNTLADLAAWEPSTLSSNFTVRSYDAARPFASARPGHYDPSSTATPDQGCVFSTSTGVGRNLMDDCNGGVVDAEWFGAQPYLATLMTPWAYQTNIAAIGTNDFSVWARLAFPSNINQPIGWFSLAAVRHETNAMLVPSQSAISFRATPSVFGFIARGTNGASGAGVAIDDAATLNTNTPSAFSAYFGTTADFVFTRSGTNVHAYLNGTLVDGLFNLENPAGWAKSVGGGYDLTLQIGLQDNGWYWPSAVERFALWRSELTAGQAANPSGTGGKAVDYTPANTSQPADCGPSINAAMDYVQSIGGGTVKLSPGKYRLSTGIRLKNRCQLVGSGAPLYPVLSQVTVGYSFGSSVLVPWFGETVDAVSVLREDQDQNDVFLVLRSLPGISDATYSLYAFAKIQGVSFFGTFASAGRGIYLDRVGSVDISDCSFVDMPGFNIYSLVGNAINVTHCTGQGGRSVHFRAAADTKILGNFFDGQYGPSLWLRGNLDVVSGNVFEVSVNPSSGAKPWKYVLTADAGNDKVTASTGLGHRLRTGDVVRFQTDGTLPSPLLINTDYYVASVDASSFRVFTQYYNDVSHAGALGGTGYIDILDAGTGTHYVSPGPSCGMLIAGDNNQVSANISHLNWENGLRLETGKWNSVVGNSFILNGYLNPDTNHASISMVATSAWNRVIGNGIDDRDITGVTQIGIADDGTSSGNEILGNSFNVSVPHSVALNNHIADASEQIHRYPYNRFYIPRSDGFSSWAADETAGFSSGIQYDSTNRRLWLSDGVTNAFDNWNYAVALPGEGPNYWSGTGSTLSVANSSTNSETILSASVPFDNSLVYLMVSSTNSPASGVRVQLVRNRAPDGASYGTLLDGDQVGEVMFVGVSQTNGILLTVAAIEAVADSDLGTNSGGGQLNLMVTPVGSVSRATQISVKDQGRIGFAVQSADPTNDVANGQVYFNTTVGLKQRRSSAWETFVTGGPFLPVTGGTLSGPVYQNKLYTGYDFAIGTWDNSSAAAGSRLILSRSRATPVGSYGTLLSGDQMGEMMFYGYRTASSGGLTVGASIEGAGDADWSTNTAGGRLNFFVTPVGATARLRQMTVMDQGRIALVAQASDPTNAVADGQLYYNSTTGKFRGRAAGAWVDIH